MNKTEIAKDLILRKYAEIDELRSEIDDIADEFMGEGHAQWHHIGSFWDCPDSPFGLCAYHIIDDPAKDGCIFCHQPQERK